MKAIPREARTKNKRSTPYMQRKSCDRCDDTGYVVASTRTETWKRQLAPARGAKEPGPWKETSAEVEEMGPCPFCEQGYVEEFGDADNQTKAPPVRSPWDAANGFWQGRDTEVVSHRDAAPRYLSREENAKQARALLARISGGMKTMDDGPDEVEGVTV